MISAVLFPLSISAVFFMAVFAPNLASGMNYFRALPWIGLAIVCTAVFGWLYFRGLKQGRAATPPVYHLARRLVFAAILIPAALFVTSATLHEAREVLRNSTEERLIGLREEVVRLRMSVPRDDIWLADRKRELALRESKLRIWGCIVCSMLFALGSVVGAVVGLWPGRVLPSERSVAGSSSGI
jgi:hypothetical protein